MTTSSAPPTPRRERPRTGRRPMAAGKVIVVMLVAALVGGLLNAAGIRKTADGQPVGLRRDLARAVAEPLYAVSHFLQIDELRKGIQALAGRSGDDDIDRTLPDPIVEDEVAPPPKKRAFSPADPVVTWVGGDSLSITPGESFVNLAPGTEVVSVVGPSVDGHVATGLARPEVFNWSGHIAEVLAADDPDTVVLTLGSNDDQTLTGEGGVGPYASPEWIAEYTRRAGGIMDQVTGDGKRTLVWIGVPPIRTRADDRYNPINDILRAEAAKRPGRVVFLDLDRRFRGPDGSYTDFLDGVQVRTPDGVHLTRAGGDIVAQMVFDALNSTYDLTSWRTAVPTTVATVAPGTPTTTGRTGKASTTTKPTSTTKPTTTTRPTTTSRPSATIKP